MKRILKYILPFISGKVRYQPFFEYLHKVALEGMNIGGGSFTTSSGEGAALDYINKKLGFLHLPVVFDVGANVGEYSILLNEKLNTPTIYAFEPAAKIFDKFTENTKQFTNIHVFNIGFSNEESVTTLYSMPQESLMSSVYKRRLDHFNTYMDETEEIKLETIDQFCENNNIKHIHLLKIDVEGHELKVLEGAKRMIQAKAIDYIQFEFGGCNIDSRTYFQDFYYLLMENYRLFRIVSDGVYTIPSYQEPHELFITTNFLAESRKL